MGKKFKWTLDDIENLILDQGIQTKKEFRDKFSGAYSAVLENKWMSHLEKHFTTLGNKFLRGVYRYMFSDGSTYTGLTDNFDRRHKEHMSKGPVYQHMIKTGIKPNKIIVSDYVDSNIATFIETNDWDYLVSEGFKPIHPRPQKQLGSNDIKWSYNKAESIVKNFDSVKEFRKQYNSLYTIICSKGWDVTKLLKKGKVERTKQECIDDIIAKNYKTKDELIKGSPRVYDSLVRNNWWKEVSEKFFPENTLYKLVLNIETGIFYNSLREACNSQVRYTYSTFQNHLNPNRNRGKNRTPFVVVV